MPDARSSHQPHKRAPELTLADTRLAHSPYLSRDERDALATAVLQSRQAGAGIDLVRQDEHTDDFHVISAGWACRYKLTRTGNRQIVALLVPGDIASLNSLLLGRQDYGVRSLSPLKLSTIARDRVLALADQHAGIMKTLAWAALGDNAILRQLVLNLGRQSARQRLAHLLCELSVRLRAADRGGMFELPLTQEQIADVLGLTSVHVNRTVQQLRAEGLIESRARAVRIVDMDKFSRIAEFDPVYLGQALKAASPSGHSAPDRYIQAGAPAPQAG